MSEAPRVVGGRVLQSTPFKVEIVGVNVKLTIGTRWIEMDYDMANTLAVFLRGAGKQAKRNAGDTSIKVLGFADLTDANLDEMKAQTNRDRTAFFSPR